MATIGIDSIGGTCDGVRSARRAAAIVPSATLAEPLCGDLAWLDRMLTPVGGEGLFANGPRLVNPIPALAQHRDG